MWNFIVNRTVALWTGGCAGSISSGFPLWDISSKILSLHGAPSLLSSWAAEPWTFLQQHLDDSYAIPVDTSAKEGARRVASRCHGKLL